MKAMQSEASKSVNMTDGVIWSGAQESLSPCALHYSMSAVSKAETNKRHMQMNREAERTQGRRNVIWCEKKFNMYAKKMFAVQIMNFR